MSQPSPSSSSDPKHPSLPSSAAAQTHSATSSAAGQTSGATSSTAAQKRRIGRGTIALIVILAVVLIDQTVKIWVKTHFYLGEDMVITKWFHLCFIENNGMAFGWTVGSKLLLTLSRIVLAGLAIWYIWLLRMKKGVKLGFIICLSLIVAGAIGNIIDCVFYGVIFNNPIPPATAALFPETGGYAALFHGRVVDMLYFPLFTFTWPDWMPMVGGEDFLFFRPIFNIADSAITIGVIAILLFYSSQLNFSKTSVDEGKKCSQTTDIEP